MTIEEYHQRKIAALESIAESLRSKTTAPLLPVAPAAPAVVESKSPDTELREAIAEHKRKEKGKKGATDGGQVQAPVETKTAEAPKVVHIDEVRIACDKWLETQWDNARKQQGYVVADHDAEMRNKISSYIKTEIVWKIAGNDETGKPRGLMKCPSEKYPEIIAALAHPIPEAVVKIETKKAGTAFD